MKAGIYYRVSTRDKQNIATQKGQVREFCEREGIETYKEYEDVGESGTKESRPAFDELINDMRKGLFQVVVVYKLDRIGRSLSHLVKLFEEFKAKKIDFIATSQSINTTTPEGRMFLHMLMVFAEYERDLTLTRIHSGLERATKEGKKLGRPQGSKDSKRRRKSGYHIRWAKEKKNKRREISMN